jgi:CheY-like chemotaxis protein
MGPSQYWASFGFSERRRGPPRYTGGVSGKTILAVVSDLMFQSRLREQARALGYEITVADTPESLRDGLARSPALFVIDLHVDGLDWRQAVEAAKRGGVPVLAFGRHTEAQLLRSAREAGCGRVVPRSTFVEELPRLIEELAGP